MTRKQTYVFEHTGNTKTGYEFIIGHNASVNGEMADGTKTWEFDEMCEDGLYTAHRKNGTMYLVRQ